MTQEITITTNQAIATLIIILALLGANISSVISIASLIQRLRQTQERLEQFTRNERKAG
jgi:hypothetical protein